MILDEYIDGICTRISPEAPVPVVANCQQYSRCGGAANVALNLALLGAEVTLIGVAGCDNNARKLETLLAGANVSSILIRDRERTTTTKTRIISNHQQIVRIDKETLTPLREEIEERLLFQASIVKADAIVLSDYDKGIFNINVAQYLCGLGNRVFVSPKPKNVDGFAGSDFLVMNESELNLVLLRYKSIRSFMHTSHLELLYITRGDKGITVYQNDSILQVCADKIEVVDVSGAGDTALAALTIGTLKNLDPVYCAQLANRAAGIAIQKQGTSYCTKEELCLTI